MQVSIVMAVYNGAKYLLEQLQSLHSQTYPINEVVICDDKSTDDSVRIVRKFIKEHNLGARWKVYRNVRNLGYADNFHKAMELATGDYIFFCDQDDIWLEDKVERMIQIMEQNREIMMLASEYDPFTCSQNAPVLSKTVIKSMNGNGAVEQIPLNRNTIFIRSEGCTMCVRRTFIEEIQMYWFSGWAHDEFVWKMALCRNGAYIYHSPTLKRRLHENNVSKQKMRDLKKRVLFLKRLHHSHRQMLAYANVLSLDDDVIHLIQKNIDSVQLRIDLLERKKVFNTVPLALFYPWYYHSKKSIPVELYLAIKG